jgi:hypothetical protein
MVCVQKFWDLFTLTNLLPVILYAPVEPKIELFSRGFFHKGKLVNSVWVLKIAEQPYVLISPSCVDLVCYQAITQSILTHHWKTKTINGVRLQPPTTVQIELAKNSLTSTPFI